MIGFPSQWHAIAKGVGFTEGCTPYNSGIAFVSINRGCVTIMSLDGGGSEIHEVGGGPNGAVADQSGNLWIAQNGGSVVLTKSKVSSSPGIQRLSPSGNIDLVASAGLFAPNDLAFGPDGRLWFTDPRGSTFGSQLGGLWALNIESGRLELIIDQLQHPNGLAFASDGESLVLGETRAKRIVSLRVSPAGKWTIDGIFCEYPHGEPDGMAFDSAGRLWVAGSAGDNLAIFNSTGEFLHMVELGPSFPTNICFAGANLETVVVTAAKGGRVLTASAPDSGVPLLSGPTA